MSKRFLLDYDPEMGMAQYIEPDADGVTLVTTSTNVKQVLDENKAMKSVNRDIRRGDNIFGHHVARIPMWLWWQFTRENPELLLDTEDSKVWLVNRLNDGEFCHLKTYDGTI